MRKPYSFSYTIYDENTGLTHARDETADEEGVVAGSYEVLDPDCVIRRVTYRASRESGFNVVDTQTRPCNDVQRKRLESGGERGERPRGRGISYLRNIHQVLLVTI